MIWMWALLCLPALAGADDGGGAGVGEKKRTCTSFGHATVRHQEHATYFATGFKLDLLRRFERGNSLTDTKRRFLISKFPKAPQCIDEEGILKVRVDCKSAQNFFKAAFQFQDAPEDGLPKFAKPSEADFERSWHLQLREDLLNDLPRTGGGDTEFLSVYRVCDEGSRARRATAEDYINYLNDDPLLADVGVPSHHDLPNDDPYKFNSDSCVLELWFDLGSVRGQEVTVPWRWQELVTRDNSREKFYNFSTTLTLSSERDQLHRNSMPVCNDIDKMLMSREDPFAALPACRVGCLKTFETCVGPAGVACSCDQSRSIKCECPEGQLMHQGRCLDSDRRVLASLSAVRALTEDTTPTWGGEHEGTASTEAGTSLTQTTSEAPGPETAETPSRVPTTGVAENALDAKSTPRSAKGFHWVVDESTAVTEAVTDPPTAPVYIEENFEVPHRVCAWPCNPQAPMVEIRDARGLETPYLGMLKECKKRNLTQLCVCGGRRDFISCETLTRTSPLLQVVFQERFCAHSCDQLAAQGSRVHPNNGTMVCDNAACYCDRRKSRYACEDPRTAQARSRVAPPEDAMSQGTMKAVFGVAFGAVVLAGAVFAGSLLFVFVTGRSRRP